MEDVQVLSSFHALRAEGRGMQAPSEQQWQEFVAQRRQTVTEASGYSDARRRSLLRRLDAAAEERPDGASFYALRNIQNRTMRQHAAVEETLRRVSATTGRDLAETRRTYRGYMQEHERSRTHRRPAGYVDEDARAARAAGLPEDEGSIAALRRMESDARHAQAQAALAGPQRIERQQIEHGPISEVGYDPDGGRLEVVFRGHGTRQALTYAYNGVPQSAYDAMMVEGETGRAFNAHVRNNSEYLYADQDAADIDSAARQCSDCGQFASAQHTCPVRVQREQEAAAAQAATEAAAEPAPARPRRRRAAAAAEPEPPAPRPEPRSIWTRSRYRYAGSLGSLRNDPTLGRGQYDNIRMPSNMTEVRQAAASGPVQFSIQYQGHRYNPQVHRVSGADDGLPVGSFNVSGDVVYDRPARGQHTVELRNPRCSCPVYQQNGDCPHVSMVRTRIQSALLPAQRGAGGAATTDPAVAQAAAEEAMRRDWTRREEAAEQMRARWAEQADEASSYSNNFAAFEEDYNSAVARKEAGEAVIPYMREDATGGLCTRESGRGFGVELEFDFPSDVNRYAALQAIGRDLHAAGLTRTAAQEHYGASRRRGYTEEHQGGWSFEQDCTVSGEIVSPVMYDEPETWQNIEKVCEIVRRHGGKGTARTGSHVHVGMRNATGAAATELVRMSNQHEDVMYRVSQSPDRASHRPMQWCGPNRDTPPSGYADATEARWQHSSHHVGVNLQSVQGRESDHAEIRHWDGTMDPAVIQTQVKISAAMVAAAERNASQSVGADRLNRETVGSHSTRLQAVRGRSRRALTSEELREDTATARSLADTLFSRREDKAQFTALFAVTKWQRPRR